MPSADRSITGIRSIAADHVSGPSEAPPTVRLTRPSGLTTEMSGRCARGDAARASASNRARGRPLRASGRRDMVRCLPGHRLQVVDEDDEVLAAHLLEAVRASGPGENRG